MHRSDGLTAVLPSLWDRVSNCIRFDLDTQLFKLLGQVAELHALVVGHSRMAEFLFESRKCGELQEVAPFVLSWLDADFGRLVELHVALIEGNYRSGTFRAVLHRVLGPGPPAREQIGLPVVVEVAA